MSTDETTPASPLRGEIWLESEGRKLLVIQHDALNRELDTVATVVVTDARQRAPEPVRVSLSPDSTGLYRRLWVKIPLLVTVPRLGLGQCIARVRDSEMQRIDDAVARVLNLSGVGVTPKL